MPPRPTARFLRLGAILAVAAVLAVAWRFGIFQRFADPARAARDLADLGPWGYVAFIAAYAIFQPFGVPGTAFIVVAPLIWPWPIAFAVSMIGTMAASVIGFSFARLLLREWVSGVIPARFRRYDEALATRAFATVFLLRLVFWMPPTLHAFLGVSKVRFWTHFWASLAGYVVPLLVVSYFGAKVFDLASSFVKNAPLSAWIELGAGAAVLAAAAWIVRRHLARREPRISVE